MFSFSILSTLGSTLKLEEGKRVQRAEATAQEWSLSGKHEALGIIPTKTGTEHDTLIRACTLRSVCSVYTLPGSSSHIESRPQSTQRSALQAAGLHAPHLDWTPDVHLPLEIKAHQCNL